ncbi:MAG: replication factor C large subunit [Nanoarchaeota archaeon]|nr:replication factor C large subunit [Nanoarchaeota archaeon]
MLIQKYKPKKLEDVKGQDVALRKLKKAVLEKKHVLIYGDIGIGKTSSVYALANDLDHEILEVNASDYRNKDQIESLIGNSSQQLSLFNKSKIILVDEIDGLNIKDRGGLQALIKLLEKSVYPIVIVGNDIWDSKFNLLRRKCELIGYSKLKSFEILSILKNISEKENIEVNNEFLMEIVNNCNGDIRAAINDLQILNVDDLRERKETIFNTLKLVLKSKDFNLILQKFGNCESNLDEIMLWLEENIAKEYSNNDLMKAYDNLSKADVFRGRIRKWQYWRFLVYQSFLLSIGVALSKKNSSERFINYKRNERILKIWIGKRKYGKKLELAEEIGERCNMSIKKSFKELAYMNFL